MRNEWFHLFLSIHKIHLSWHSFPCLQPKRLKLVNSASVYFYLSNTPLFPHTYSFNFRKFKEMLGNINQAQWKAAAWACRGLKCSFKICSRLLRQGNQCWSTWEHKVLRSSSGLYLVMYGPTVFKISLKSDIWFTVARLMLRQQLHDQCEDVRIIQT